MSAQVDALLREVEARAQLPAPMMRRAIRTSAHVSQQRVADALGVTSVTVHRWEHGTCTPRGEMLVAYVDLLRRLEALS